MWTKIVSVVALLVAALGAVIQMQPAEFKVARKLKIQAPASVVYEQLTDFHKWDGWSPWAKLDPAMKTVYSGPASGVGASYHWVGNDEVGEGNMEIKAVKPAEQVDIQLDFLKPFEAHNDTSFKLQPEVDGVVVNWEMTGRNNFMAKAFAMVMNMDQMVGKDFEKGLAQLKTVSEKTVAEAKK
jgi:hypothetical protein